ncbi:10819_t:CDS:2 [Diversispora eburnea]|uniref:10819_t:CDS:1 n=1 Tax=Diversispora eburnea TaxID=1213867 RepID=A0A9N9BFQ8_9GLOM|nr:10819_t:CDS:2 [Diversispora eburnea]
MSNLIYLSTKFGYGYPQQYETQNPPNELTNVNVFFDEISTIQEMIKQAQENINRINELHSRSLGTISEDESSKQQLEALTSNTRKILTEIKDKIRKLESVNLGLPPNTGDLGVRNAQTENLRKKFMETLGDYQKMEYQNRQKYRARMERQYRIVNPQATQDEIEAALDNDEGEQVFAQSLMTATRYGAAKDALREVQERHNDIKKIEKTIEELANLFQEMQMVVEAQEVVVTKIEEQTNHITTDLETGATLVDQALVSAKGARRKKWYCFAITVVLVIIIAVVLYIYLKPKTMVSTSSDGNTSTVTSTVAATPTS